MKLKTLIPLAVLASAAFLVRAEPKETEAPKALRVLLLTGGCCHDYDNQKLLIPAGIGERANVEFTVIHEGGKGQKHQFELLKKEGWEKNFDAVLYNICFAGEDDVEYIESVTNTHKAGLPAVALHCTYHSHHWKAKTDEWERFIGVTSPNHGPHVAVTVTPAVPDHPVMKGFPATWITPKDELYNVDKVWPSATVLANGDNGKKNQPCVWVNDFDGTRVFGTTIGHYNETIAEPVFLDLLTRGLLWSVGKLDDEGKPLPGYGRK
jgi:type 1 glutamine amidotransferase